MKAGIGLLFVHVNATQRGDRGRTTDGVGASVAANGRRELLQLGDIAATKADTSVKPTIQISIVVASSSHPLRLFLIDLEQVI